MIIASPRRHFVEPKEKRSKTPDSGHDPRLSSDILMEYTAENDVARKIQLPSPVTVFELGMIHEIVGCRQADLRYRWHSEQRTGPDKAIAPAMVRACTERRIVDARGR